VVSRAKDLGRILKATVQDGKVFSPVSDYRIAICRICHQYDGISCKECKCFMEAKVKLHHAKCPLQKW